MRDRGGRELLAFPSFGMTAAPDAQLLTGQDANLKLAQRHLTDCELDVLFR